jgi:23S rRNA pseudouridine1911/1915/1917 synthase
MTDLGELGALRAGKTSLSFLASSPGGERRGAVANIRIEVPSAASGSRLDQFLAEPLGSRARAQRLIDEARVRVDGRVRRKRHEVQAGELIDVDDDEPVGDAPMIDVPFGIAFEDEHLIVVDKPAGVVVHPGRGHRSGTLSQALAGRAAGGDEPWRAGIVHRLDRETSGLLVVAKRDEVHRALKALLAARKLKREYLALVAGTPAARTGTIEAPIGRDRRRRTLMSIDSDEPREARTHFEILEVLPSSTLLKVSLDTGRTHQIRVHLQSIGYPVCGDRQYGGGDAYGLTRQFLHAARLAFPHPVTSEPIDVSSPLPDDLAFALNLASRE